jgi:hypothetical protein
LLKFVPIVGKTITVNVEPIDGVNTSFPDNFHWGVATAGFQAEGGPGNQLLGLTHGVPENGPGTYVSYNSDAALAHDKLGMNTFRMSPAKYVHPERRLALLLLFHRLLDFIDADLAHRLPQ